MMLKKLFLTILIFRVFVACSQQPAPAPGAFAIVKTEAGAISGTANDDASVHIFKGIPFAAPPVGDLRWKAPKPVIPWTGIKACTVFAKSPMQPKPNEFGVYTREFLIKDEPLSEDCLYLNIWTGAKAPADKHPVIVWIYGGGFVSGGTNVPIYDGEALAKKGAILVSIPYRVGIFGFFAHPELTKESPNHASGNYGLLDLIAALKWIKQNIEAFGGDPNNITIAGQSAGAFNVNYLVASPLGKGLFKHAIAESGANFLNGPLGGTSLEQAEKAGFATAAKLGATTLAELRKLSAEELLKQHNMRPVIDGYVLPESVAAIFAAHKENRVDLLTGWNEDDAFIGELKNAADYTADIRKKYGAKADDFLKYYPGSTDAEAERSQINSSRDIMFGVQNFTWANVQAATQSPVFLYRFTRRVPATPAFEKYGAFHTGEVGYAFNNLKFLHRPFGPVDRQLADIMSSYWVNFAKTGNPNGTGLPHWPVYTAGDSQTMILGEKPAAQPLPDKAALTFMVTATTPSLYPSPNRK